MTIQMASMGLAPTFASLRNVTSLSDTGLASATYGIDYIFQTDGTVDLLTNEGSDSFDNLVFRPSTVGSNLWLRLTVNSGLSPDSGPAAGSWWILTSQRWWAIDRTLGETGYNWTFDLATDSGGSNIIDTKTVNGLVGKIV